MDIFFKVFEQLFNKLQDMGVDNLTGVYLTIQILFFIVLLLSYLKPYSFEMRSMNFMKKQLENLKKDKNANINLSIQEAFNKVKKGSRYKVQWKKYYNRITEKEDDEKIKIAPFFGVDALHIALDKRGVMDIGSGLHVSLGVLGTFLGLSVGLADLNLTDTDELRTGVAGLIGGMKVAFYTSVLGVFLSILWTFIDRFLAGSLEKEIDWHSNELGYLLDVDDGEIFLNRMEKISQQQADQMKTILSDALEHVMQPLVQTVQQGNQQVSSTISSMSSNLTDVYSQLKEQSEVSKEHLNFLKNQGSDVSSKLVDEISKGTNDTIDQFIEMMEVSKSTQSEMYISMQNVARQLEANATSNQLLFDNTNRMISLFSSLSNEMESTQTKYVESIDNIEDLSVALREMQNMQKENMPVQQSLVEQNHQFMQRSDELVNSLIRLNDTQERVQKESIESLVEKTNLVSERFESLAEEVKLSAIEQSKSAQQSSRFVESMSENLELLQEISKPIETAFVSMQKLHDDLGTMQQLQSSLLPQLTDWNENTISQINTFQSLTKEQLANMENQLSLTKEQWTLAAEDFENTRKNLGGSLKEFNSNIESSITNTFQLFDKELVNIVNHFRLLSQAYEDSQQEFGDAVELLVSKIEPLKEGAKG